MPKEDGTADCEKLAKYYRSLCPGEWVSVLLSFVNHCNYFSQLRRDPIRLFSHACMNLPLCQR
ncbi:hypothetical protein HU200_006594 [Digitaria exilis]|uniref:Uncharacterized protein n=1 Tax=Digitaria exilis TaxID=1010633 RepID=A0A835FRT9_9POAL|nr:hypothetical protein HU200_006594 [Digitaria exilis]